MLTSRMERAFRIARPFVTSLSFATALWGCPSEELASLRPCTRVVGRGEITQTAPSRVDLLLLVDDSKSMKDEQVKLANELPSLLSALTTGQIDDDGVQDFRPVDLHVGIITPNLGAPGSGLDDPNAGDACSKPEGGVLRAIGASKCSQAVDVDTKFLTASSGADNSAFVEQARCMVTSVGSEGCGLEAQLDAALKAVSKRSANLPFVYGGTGEGDGANNGFVREDALLVIVLVTDEDDCSVQDPSFFTTPKVSENLKSAGMRCHERASLLQPLERYLKGFRDLKPSRPDLVLFTAITGVPPQLVSDPEAIDYQALLGSPEMVVRSDEFMGSNGPAPVPACRIVVPGGESETTRDTNDQTAAPARRIAELAAMFGEQGLVQSICQDDFRSALSALAKRISKVLGSACLPRKLNPNADGLVRCNVLETLPPGSACDASRGRSLKSTGQTGEVICKVSQLPVVNGAPVPGAGWYYDPSTTSESCQEGSGQVRFTKGAEPADKGKVNLECLEPVVAGETKATDWDAVGLACDPATGGCKDHLGQGKNAARLFCEPESRTCQAECSSDAQCIAPMICDTSLARPFCVNPTCQ